MARARSKVFQGLAQTGIKSCHLLPKPDRKVAAEGVDFHGSPYSPNRIIGHQGQPGLGKSLEHDVAAISDVEGSVFEKGFRLDGWAMSQALARVEL